ncbi:uncharacterized protein [Epargyreus clarus]|uniref:uncharacterized protein n=1 Tax=Epargyreus clarus TaxID=520877 RepID=UPI003C2FC2E1
MIPGEMVIEKVHGLQSTGITLSERFAIMTAEHIARVAKVRRRPVANYQNVGIRKWNPSNQTLRMFQLTPRQQPVKQRLGMPGLRRFGSDGNLPGLQRSNSFGSLGQFRNRIPWRQSNGNLSRAGSVSNLSQASWHGRGGFVRRGGRIGPLRGRMRGRGRQQQVGWPRAGRPQGGRLQRPQRGAVRGRGRGRGRANNQQNNNQQTGNQQTGNQQTGNQGNRNQTNNQGNRNQQVKTVPTKEELDAQLDEYMATSQLALDKQLEEYMLKGALMEFE